MKYFFIGIGGSGMSALSGYLAEKGEKVSGCDEIMSETTKSLRLRGIDVTLSAEELPEADVFVYSAAIPCSDVILRKARASGKKVMRRDVLLASVFNRFPCSVAVSGMHGKTTASALLTHVLSFAGLNPSAFLGGKLKQGGRNFICGGESYCVAEACEYKKSFLHLSPTIAVILNTDLDHTDCYPDMESVYKAYNEFVAGSKENAVIIAHETCRDFLRTDRRVLYFGTDADSDFRAENYAVSHGKYSFDAFFGKEKICRIKPNLYGKHNSMNALAVFACACLLKIDGSVISEAMESFSGIERRMDVKLIGNKEIIEDYAHHPEQIVNLIKTARETGRKKVVAVFQPHTYSRTKSLINRFAECFDQADEVILLPVYKARESLIKGGTSLDLMEKIRERNPTLEVRYAEYFFQAANMINALPPFTCVLLIGAGDVTNVEKFL